VEVLGSRGLVSCDNVAATTTTVADAAGFHRPPLPHFFPERYQDAYVRELECFAGAIRGVAAGPTGEDGRRALLASLAARRSVLERRAVRLDELG
jgi:myo-inositol 2-dehydrogenase/D-chiro-inositol 1-dehydrogenase